MSEVLARRMHWSSAIAQCVVGRDRVIDVLPAGLATNGGAWENAGGSFAAEVDHIGGRYDTLIVSAPVSRRGVVTRVAASVPDAVVCVRISRTPVRLLKRIISEARADGARLRGLVLWARPLDQMTVKGAGSRT